MVETWANGFGVWHVRVSRTAASPLLAARRALRTEIQQRDPEADRSVWLFPVRVPELDTLDTRVYREALPDEDRIEMQNWIEARIREMEDAGVPYAQAKSAARYRWEHVQKVRLPYSEVCMHMRVAGTLMFVEPLPRNMAQLYSLFGDPFSFPITRGEAFPAV